MTNNRIEGESYFDEYERRRTQPTTTFDSLSRIKPVVFGSVGVVNKEVFDRLFGERPYPATVGEFEETVVYKSGVNAEDHLDLAA